MGWKERTLSSCSFLVSQGSSSSSSLKGSWVVTSDGLLSSSSSFSRSAGAWRSFQTTQEVAAAAEKQQPMGGDHTKGHGNKKKMNLFSAINNALYTALDTDPRSTWSSSLANSLPAYLVGCCEFHSFVMLWISGVFFFSSPPQFSGFGTFIPKECGVWWWWSVLLNFLSYALAGFDSKEIDVCSSFKFFNFWHAVLCPTLNPKKNKSESLEVVTL